MMRVDGNVEALSIKGIEGLAVTAESDKFCGCSGAKAQGTKAPGGIGIVVTASGAKSLLERLDAAVDRILYPVANVIELVRA